MAMVVDTGAVMFCQLTRDEKLINQSRGSVTDHVTVVRHVATTSLATSAGIGGGWTLLRISLQNRDPENIFIACDMKLIGRGKVRLRYAG